MRFLLIAMAVLVMAGCAKKNTRQSSESMQEIKLESKIIGGPTEFAIPKATVFKMNGPYENNVAVTLNPDGSLAYYPAPTDIMENSAPYSLGDGWWLNRQGIGPNSVFTKWTFADYCKLKRVPGREEILDAIIPGSGVTEFRELPLPYSEARSNPSLCKKYL